MLRQKVDVLDEFFFRSHFKEVLVMRGGIIGNAVIERKNHFWVNELWSPKERFKKMVNAGCALPHD